MSGTIIKTVNLYKNFRKVKALNGLNLNVPKGSIFGFLGRNGSGKTTTIKILMGMAKPSSGRVNIFGLDPTDAKSGVAIRRRIGFVSEDKQLYVGMNVEQMLHFLPGTTIWKKNYLPYSNCH